MAKIRRHSMVGMQSPMSVLLSLLLLPALSSAQQSVPSVITSLVSSDGCASTGPQLGDTNLYDGIISDFFCPPPPNPDPVPPELVVSADSSIVTGIRVYAATQNEGADPTSYTIDGRTENGVWIPISNGVFDDDWNDAWRNPVDAIIDSSFSEGDPDLDFGEAIFVNTGTFSEYRITFPTTRSYPAISPAYVLRIGELELMGVLVNEPPIPTYVSENNHLHHIQS